MYPWCSSCAAAIVPPTWRLVIQGQASAATDIHNVRVPSLRDFRYLLVASRCCASPCPETCPPYFARRPVVGRPSCSALRSICRPWGTRMPIGWPIDEIVIQPPWLCPGHLAFPVYALYSSKLRALNGLLAKPSVHFLVGNFCEVKHYREQFWPFGARLAELLGVRCGQLYHPCMLSADLGQISCVLLPVEWRTARGVHL